ncbi:MAG: OadG family protein [Desulfobacterales bacterium]|jgi:hypothetical protein|nr:OadG family protein [Desulfobacteraceae bacterium]MBT4365070.1 OadG family protein [Desulfobacteraceae bacterium]MBT7085880.1 OadG family protein [Desulfobacterales bacterium]MBT7697838.1 OadG family protein [Desulfobacterales bacterium]
MDRAFDIVLQFIINLPLITQKGLQNISDNNGWAMAIVGAITVFSGLVILALTISQLPNLILLLEKFKKTNKVDEISETPTSLKPDVQEYLSTDINKVANLYRPLFEKLGDSFPLSALYDLSQKEKLPHPHITITSFREADILISKGDGIFTWNKELV